MRARSLYLFRSLAKARPLCPYGEAPSPLSLQNADISSKSGQFWRRSAARNGPQSACQAGRPPGHIRPRESMLATVRPEILRAADERRDAARKRSLALLRGVALIGTRKAGSADATSASSVASSSALPVAAGPRWHKARDVVRLRLATARALQLNVGVAFALGNHDRAKEYLKKLRNGVFNQAHMVKQREQLQVKRQAEEAARMTGAGSIVTESTARQLAQVPLWQQGDPSLSTEEKLKERKALRRERLVIEVLNAFWDCALRTKAHTYFDTGTGETMVTREGYECLFMRGYKILVEEWDPEDAASCIAEDWQNDSHYGDGRGLTYAAYCDSLFEVADLWVPSIDAAAYAHFLWKLFQDITDGGEWKALDDCGFDSYLAASDDVSEEVQSISRLGAMARLTKIRRWAAKKLQSNWRGAKARREVRRRRKAVAQIQKDGRKRVARKMAKRASVPGERGTVQHWALRKGLSSVHAEEMAKLNEEDQAIIEELDEKRRARFLDMIAEREAKAQRKRVELEARMERVRRQRVAQEGLNEQDRAAISNMDEEKRARYLEMRAAAADRKRNELEARRERHDETARRRAALEIQQAMRAKLDRQQAQQKAGARGRAVLAGSKLALRPVELRPVSRWPQRSRPPANEQKPTHEPLEEVGEPAGLAPTAAFVRDGTSRQLQRSPRLYQQWSGLRPDKREVQFEDHFREWMKGCDPPAPPVRPPVGRIGGPVNVTSPRHRLYKAPKDTPDKGILQMNEFLAAAASSESPRNNKEPAAVPGIVLPPVDDPSSTRASAPKGVPRKVKPGAPLPLLSPRDLKREPLGYEIEVKHGSRGQCIAVQLPVRNRISV